ncbi:MAG: S4 domain-containing protein, partial [Hydrogenobaculum sp.]
MKKRLDILLVEKGLVSSREKAQAFIMEGRVFVNGKAVLKAGTLVQE